MRSLNKVVILKVKAVCVGWMFKSKGVFVIEKKVHDEDDVTMLALEAGAENLKSEDDVI